MFSRLRRSTISTKLNCSDDFLNSSHLIETPANEFLKFQLNRCSNSIHHRKSLWPWLFQMMATWLMMNSMAIESAICLIVDALRDWGWIREFHSEALRFWCIRLAGSLWSEMRKAKRFENFLVTASTLRTREKFQYEKSWPQAAWFEKIFSVKSFTRPVPFSKRAFLFMLVAFWHSWCVIWWARDSCSAHPFQLALGRMLV